MTPPVFSHGSLRLYLLMLLNEQPRHGYELIQALSDRFGGTYVPSAGTIYPRLAKLEDEGLVSKETDGRKSVYAITDAGRAELAARQGDLNSIENELTDSVRRLADEVRAGVNHAMKSLRADLASAAREAKRDVFADGTWSTTGFEGTHGGASTSGSSGGAESSESRTSSGAQSQSEAGAKSQASSHVESNRALHDADVALTQFRQQLRTELRKRAVRGNVSRDSVDLLQRRLAEVHSEVLASLGEQVQ